MLRPPLNFNFLLFNFKAYCQKGTRERNNESLKFAIPKSCSSPLIIVITDNNDTKWAMRPKSELIIVIQ